ncbi:GIY-YIG nuclease family protein [bacterium]|nr:GIY-YIG nuclease family protein [bacterium]
MSQKKRHGLIEADLESISSMVFDKYHEAITKLVGKRHGVYALYSKNTLYYVGLATDLRNRIKQHLNDKHAMKWDRFSLFLIKNVNYLKELESLIVHIAEPKGNTQRGRFVHSQNLHFVLKKLLDDQYERDRTQILSNQNNIRNTPKKRLSKISGRKSDGPILYNLLPTKSTLRKTYNGKNYTATVNKDGSISVGNHTFNSPSLAASYVRNGKATNGWTFWQYKNKKGEWVYLDELR